MGKTPGTKGNSILKKNQERNQSPLERFNAGTVVRAFLLLVKTFIHHAQSKAPSKLRKVPAKRGAVKRGPHRNPHPAKLIPLSKHMRTQANTRRT